MSISRWVCAGAFAAGWVVACGGTSPAPEVTRAGSSPIQAGTTDSTHKFAVGVVQVTATTTEFCSGSLLAPNLVATARHCVAQISSPQIDCSKATFGSLLPTSTLFVTNDTTITSPQMGGTFVAVASGGIYVPPGNTVCGNDIALLVLQQSITLPGRYPAVTAIGYGIDTPTDDSGVTAGTRRIKENASLYCVPNAPNFLDCFSDPSASQYMTMGEFISGDQTTCEGDSGSGVYDQAQFNAGKWVSFGVLSRGSVSADGLSCVQPIYTRFDAWGSLLTQAATAAAAKGGYALPSWAGGAAVSSDASIAPPVDGGQATQADGSTSGSSGGSASSGAGSSSGGRPAIGADGTVCHTNSDCLSQNCVAFDGVHFYCASACGDGGTCPDQFSCEGPWGGNYCFPSSSVPMSGSGSSGGCSVDRRARSSSGPPSLPASWALGGIAALLSVRAGRKRRRGAASLSGS